MVDITLGHLGCALAPHCGNGDSWRQSGVKGAFGAARSAGTLDTRQPRATIHQEVQGQSLARTRVVLGGGIGSPYRDLNGVSPRGVRQGALRPRGRTFEAVNPPVPPLSPSGTGGDFFDPPSPSVPPKLHRCQVASGEIKTGLPVATDWTRRSEATYRGGVSPTPSEAASLCLPDCVSVPTVKPVELAVERPCSSSRSTSQTAVVRAGSTS